MHVRKMIQLSLFVATLAHLPLSAALDDFTKPARVLTLDEYKQRKLARFEPEHYTELYGCVDGAGSTKAVDQCIQIERKRRMETAAKTVIP